MGKWILQANDALQIGSPSEARGQLVFHTDLHNGLTEATQRGFVKGGIVQVRHRDVYVANVGAKNIGGIDEVTIDVIGATGVPPPLRAQKPHKANDEEWTGGSGCDEASPDNFVRADGLSDSGMKEYLDGLDDATKLLMPKPELTQKKWITPPYGTGTKASPRVLPSTYTQTQSLLGSITWAKPGFVMGGGDQAKWLCTDQNWEADGDLLCIVSKFTHNPKGWDVNIYPAVGGGTYGAKRPAVSPLAVSRLAAKKAP